MAHMPVEIIGKIHEVSIAYIFRKYQNQVNIAHAIEGWKPLHGIRRGLGTGMTASGTPVDMASQILGCKWMKAIKQHISADSRAYTTARLALIRWEVASMNLPKYIREMLEYKESLGYSRKTYESYLKDF